MDLEGQGAARIEREADRSRLDDRGFILVALLIGIAVASVWMAALLPAWRQQVIRGRETELIFRGEQYARAIWLYRQKMNGALPTNLDDLVDQHVLRHKWKDPITNDEFLPKVSCLVLPTGGGPGGGGSLPGRAGSAPRGLGGVASTSMELFQAPARGGGGRPVTPGGTPAQPPGRGTQFPGTAPRQGAPGGGFGGAPQGGICGVQSRSTETSIKIYNGQQEYDLWEFDINTAQALFARDVQRLGGAGSAPQIGLPGQPGRGTPQNLGPGIGQPPRGRGAGGRRGGGPGAGRAFGPGGPGTRPTGPGIGPGRGRG